MSNLSYTWCMDTINREILPAELKSTNPTNDVTLKFGLSVNRMQVRSMELVSIELPRTQRLIEQRNSLIYIANGVPLYYGGPGDEVMGTWIVEANGMTVTATVPLVLNPIVDLDDSDPSTPVFTTERPHELSKASMWDFGEDVQIISTPTGTLFITEDGILNPSLTVLSPTTFSIGGFSPTTVWKENPASTKFGYLYFPAISTPVKMGEILTFAIREAWAETFGADPGVSPVIVGYDITTSYFRTFVNPAALCKFPFLTETNLLVPTEQHLANTLGFGTGCIPYASQPDPLTIVAGRFWRQMSYFQIPPGDYLADTLVRAMQLQCNRFWLSTELVHRIYFSTPTGLNLFIEIPPGLYNPNTYASTVEDRLRSEWPPGDFRVRWSDHTRRFTLSSVDVFTINWTLSEDTQMASRMGFVSSLYTDLAVYTSDSEVVVATYNFDNLQSPTRYSSTICDIHADIETKKVTVNAHSNPPLDAATTTLVGTSGTAVLSNNVRAHGLQVDDVVTVRYGSERHELVVLETPTGFKAVLDLAAIVLPVTSLSIAGVTITDLTNGALSFDTEFPDVKVDDALSLAFQLNGQPQTVASVVQSVAAGTTVVQSQASVLPSSVFGLNPPGVQLSQGVSAYLTNPNNANLLFSKKCDSIDSPVVGFPLLDLLAVPGVTTLTSPFVYDLEKPRYVLLEMLTPVGSSRTESRYKDSNKTTILAKVILDRLPVVRRFYPMTAHFFTGVKLTVAKFRLINPDYTPYELHNHDWAATFRLFLA